MDEMNFVMVPKSVWSRMLESIEQIKSDIETIKKEKSSDELLTSEEARKMLDICPSTWQEYRDNKIIPFSQIGRKIYVKRSDINDFIEKYMIR